MKDNARDIDRVTPEFYESWERENKRILRRSVLSLVAFIFVVAGVLAIVTAAILYPGETSQKVFGK